MSTVTVMRDGELIELPIDEVQPETPPILPQVPQTVTPRQAKLALLQAGLLNDTEAAIAAADRATQIGWEDATEFRRDDPLVAGIGAALGLADEQIDDLFLVAATL